MNREIKFRVWDHFNNCFVLDYDKTTESEIVINLNGLLAISTINSCYKLDQKRYTIQQFTGLLDKNQKEIYEGDVVETEDGKYAIEWVYYGFDLVNVENNEEQLELLSKRVASTWKIIGNI